MLYKYVKREVRHTPKLPSEKKSQRRMRILFSSLCFVVGIGILGYSTYPYLNNYLYKMRGKESKVLLTPSPLSTASASSPQTSLGDSPNFSSDYVSNVNRNFSVTNKLLNINQKTFPEYADIKGEMKLSIPSLNLKDIPIKINVDSFSESSYMAQLDKSLAHFQGTSLPDKPGNTFVYGHSANVLLAKTSPNDPKFAFTFLNDMDIGDEIVIEYEGKTYSYAAQKIKMVSPDDISPIYTTSESKSLTLMTCWPPGIGSERLILTAKQI